MRGGGWRVRRWILRRRGGRMNGRGRPRARGAEYRRLVAEREVRGTLAEIGAAGVEVMYRSLDVRDVAAVEGAIGEARRSMGPIRGVIHGAGVLQDRLI